MDRLRDRIARGIESFDSANKESDTEHVISELLRHPCTPLLEDALLGLNNLNQYNRTVLEKEILGSANNASRDESIKSMPSEIVYAIGEVKHGHWNRDRVEVLSKMLEKIESTCRNLEMRERAFFMLANSGVKNLEILESRLGAGDSKAKVLRALSRTRINDLKKLVKTGVKVDKKNIDEQFGNAAVKTLISMFSDIGALSYMVLEKDEKIKRLNKYIEKMQLLNNLFPLDEAIKQANPTEGDNIAWWRTIVRAQSIAFDYRDCFRLDQRAALAQHIVGPALKGSELDPIAFSRLYSSLFSKIAIKGEGMSSRDYQNHVQRCLSWVDVSWDRPEIGEIMKKLGIDNQAPDDDRFEVVFANYRRAKLQAIKGANPEIQRTIGAAGPTL